jgi:hypothetical protein
VTERVVIERRFCGPPESANGGYTCGVLAQHVDGTAEVTLHRPPPLDRPLVVDRRDGVAVLLDGGELVAEGRPAELELDVPKPVGLDEAERAARSSPFLVDHPFPTCFVCGPERAEGDGLRIFPGSVEGREVAAGPWRPDPSVAEDGVVRPEFVWGALDCTSSALVGNPGGKPPVVLGRLTAELPGLARAGEAYVAIGWRIGVDGRKREGGSAVFSDTGDLVGRARAVWIELRT